jgi:Arc/MetJ-type ribon-helix-helix transcriptional regulator
MKHLNLRITIRVEEKQRKKIEQAISQGKARNISELIRFSISEFLGKRRAKNASE